MPIHVTLVPVDGLGASHGETVLSAVCGPSIQENVIALSFAFIATCKQLERIFLY